MREERGILIRYIAITTILGAWAGATSFPDIISVLKAIFSHTSFRIWEWDFSYFSQSSLKTMELLDMNMAELIMLVSVFIAVLVFCVLIALWGNYRYKEATHYFPKLQEQKDISNIKQRLANLEIKNIPINHHGKNTKRIKKQSNKKS